MCNIAQNKPLFITIFRDSFEENNNKVHNNTESNAIHLTKYLNELLQELYTLLLNLETDCDIDHFLIGYFYQHGIGCKVDEIKPLEIFSDAVKNNQ
ncbi:hypothetical protein C1646_766321 [Rhizophagus diaphanus]|nr:hypothetical protein C1646_766321 [Rhizophagus diaphanus] [Rhizophagus sp. MUCL 43196]